MDAFVSELFDISGIDHSVFLDPSIGCLSHSLLMKDERLVTNAAFRFAWQKLSGGPMPSARCFAQFALGCPGALTLGSITDWLLKSSDGPFHILSGTALMRERLATLQDGCFDAFVAAIRDARTGQLHLSLVKKLVDRHSTSLLDEDLNRVISRYLTKPLFITFRDLTWRAGIADVPHQITNLASGMVASREEERDIIDDSSRKACRALPRVGQVDSIKRRFARDLHFLRRQFARHYVTAPADLKAYAEVVRMAIDAPWVVDDRNCLEVERHAPVIASACVRLHTYGFGPTLRPPADVIRGASGPHPCSMLIIFGAGSEVSDSELAEFGKRYGYNRIFRAHTHSHTHLSPYVPTRFNDSRMLVYPLFFGLDGSDDWTYGILASCLRKHLSSQCPLQSLNAADSHLLVDRCVLRCALSRGLLSPVTPFITSRFSKKAILAIDSRPDPSATVLSVAMALSCVANTRDWSVHIMCSRRNRSEFTRMMLPICPGAVIDDTSPDLNVPVKAFDIESSYNNLMKRADTWRSLLPAEIVLTVQDDGLLMRPGIEALIDQDEDDGGLMYVGAPWADHPCNLPLKHMVPDLNGNGGLSLRSVPTMIDIANGLSDLERRRLFHTRLELVPEDVIYASLASHDRSSPPSIPLSCEQVPCLSALGFHKPWPYWSVEQTHTHMELLISES